MSTSPRWWRAISGRLLFLLLTLVTACRPSNPTVIDQVGEPTVTAGALTDTETTPSTPVKAQRPTTNQLPFDLSIEAWSFKGSPEAKVVIVEFSDYQ